MPNPKHGIIHDYDLMANREDSAQGKTCEVCGVEDITFQWSDFHGEGMCTKCGVPYQLRAGSEAQKKEGNYPYLRMKDEWVPIAQEYHKETGAWTYFGMMLGGRPPGMDEFYAWVDKNHPEMIADKQG